LNPPSPPLPLGISINLPWGGNGYFLELHIVSYTLTIHVLFSGSSIFTVAAIQLCKDEE